MKIFVLAIFAVMFAASCSFADSITAPDGKTLKVHWAVLQAKPGKLPEIASISARTVAKFTPSEAGSYALYGAVDKNNTDLMRILEVYENEEAYQVHRESEGFKAFISERVPILESLKILPVDPIILEQKREGIGKIATMTLYEVKPEKLSDFKKIITREFSGAVKEIPGVLGLFATSEQGERNNFIHTLEIFSDDGAREKFLPVMKNFDEFIISRKEIENLPANIILSSKGLH